MSLKMQAEINHLRERVAALENYFGPVEEEPCDESEDPGEVQEPQEKSILSLNKRKSG